jgi:rRNA maturation RNase YbeY
MPSRFYEQNISAKLKNKRKLSTFLDAYIKKYIKNLKLTDLAYIFCDDEYLLEINQRFLEHNTLTDIITFNLSDTAGELKAEIYISVERVRENSEKFGVSYENELHRVIFHGALHLCGFKDKKPADKKEMQGMENKWLRGYFK